ncbi:MAG: hypothetical protein J1E00_09430, partial [Oscillospiraceae bacterium]|nr:hypothetical protein [Oscillospiraceae bacterium]
MTKQEWKRFLPLLLLSIVILGTVLMITVMAADDGSVLGGKITVAHTTSGTANNASVNVDRENDIVTATAATTRSLFWNSTSTNTITIKNASGADAMLFFRYTLELGGGSMTIAGENKTESGVHLSSVSAGGTVTIKLESPSAVGTAKVTLYDFALITNEAYTIQFTTPVGGRVKVNGTDLSEIEGGVVSATYNEGARVEAVPDDGYELFGWFIDESVTPFLSDLAGTIQPTKDCTITAVFAPVGTAQFGVGIAKFVDLNKAAAYADAGTNKTIVVLTDGTLAAGEYTIPKGVTLLVPFDAANTLYTTAPGISSNDHVTPNAFRTLTMAEGASITVNGAISVGSQITASGSGNSSWNGTPTGEHGKIQMIEGSSITLNSGANLYAWGYIAGDGTVTALSGANVYECFQMRSWRGGNATTGMKGGHVFPLSQYYVQNIEAKLVIYAGAKETVFSAVTVTLLGTKSTSVTFIGQNDGMFQIASGYVSKQYLPATDQLLVEAYGNISLSPMTLAIAGYSFDSREYPLPINSNIKIHVRSGKAIVNQDLALLPGAEMQLDEGAEIEIVQGKSIYVYDKDQWGNYAHQGLQLIPVGYSTVNGTKTMRTAAGLTDAKVDINGIVTAKGFIYTTESGAEIISTKGTGKIIFVNGAGADKVTYQATQSGNETSEVEIPITPAWLKNEITNPQFTETKDIEAGATFIYANGRWGDETKFHDVTWKDGNGDVLYTEKYYEDDTPVYKGKTPTKAEDEGHTYKWTGEWDAELSPVSGNVTYTATFETITKTFTITWLNDDGSELRKDEVEYGKVPEYGDTSALVSSKAAGDIHNTYTFANWDKDPDEVKGDTQYMAVYTPTPVQHTATWIDEGDNVHTEHFYNAEYPNSSLYTGAPKRADTAEWEYKRTWKREVLANGDITYTAEYSQTKQKYTITWLDDDGSSLGTTEVEYGTIPTHAEPTKAADAQYTYTFAGWKEEPVAVTGPATYTATYTKEVRTYTITWLNDDGKPITITQVAYGEKPVFPEKFGTPVSTKGTIHYKYTFTGWGEIADVTGEASYTAQYSVEHVEHTATWVDENQNVHTEHFYDETYPEASQYTGAPKKQDTPKYHYERTWERTVDEATGDITYTAVYKESVRKYTITWKNDNGDVLTTTEVAYDETPEYPADEGTPISAYAANDIHYTYKFIGFGDIKPVTGEASYTAQYEKTAVQHTAIWLDGDGKEVYRTTFEGATLPEYKGGVPTKTSTEALTFTFSGEWEEMWATNGDVTLTAKFTSEARKYKITWYDENGTTILATSEVAYGTVPSYPENGPKPTKASTIHATYTFKGWSPELKEVDGDFSYRAVYTENLIEHTATWVIDGKPVHTETFTNEEYPKPDEYGVNTEKESSVSTDYTFVKWVMSGPDAKGNITYTAEYTESTRKYKITWVLDNGEDPVIIEVEYGKLPVYPNADPTKEATIHETYEFKGWDKEIVKVDGDATYTAKYEVTKIPHTAIWINDGNIVKSATFFYEEVPKYDGKEPTKAATAQYTYTFNGWQTAWDEKTGNVIFVAEYDITPTKYTITWLDEDNKVLAQTVCKYDEFPVYPYDLPAKPADIHNEYVFVGWTPEVVPVTGTAVYKATYRLVPKAHTAKWVIDGETVHEETFYQTEYPDPNGFGVNTDKAPSDSTVYTFVEWVKGEPEANGDITYTAMYSEEVRKYTITFTDENGETLYSAEFEYGSMPEYKGVEPTKASTKHETYEFAGWDKPLEKVTGAATYKVVFDVIPVVHTATWYDEDGKAELDSATFTYTKVPAYSKGEPTKEADAEYTYKFNKWTEVWD